MFNDTVTLPSMACLSKEYIDRVFRAVRLELRGDSMGERRTETMRDRDGASICNGMDYRGCMVPVYTDNHDEALAVMEKLEPSENGVMICSYPRSGNQWVFDTVNTIKSGRPEPVVEPLFEASFLEVIRMFGHSTVCPDLVYTHFTPDLIPPQLLHKYRVIRVIRNPKDVAVSFYNFSQNYLQFNYSGTWDAFLDMFLTGTVPYGSWFEYVQKWDDYAKQHQVLTVNYESLSNNYMEEVQKIATFIGRPVTLGFCAKMSEQCSFGKMKKVKLDNTPDYMMNMWKGGVSSLLRKGSTGDWKNWFTVAQNEKFNSHFQQTMKDCDALTQYPMSFVGMDNT